MLSLMAEGASNAGIVRRIYGTEGTVRKHVRSIALTHDAEKGTGTPMLMARSGHTSVRSLARYARVSAEALAATRPSTTRRGAG